uniref:Large ribosomal subunit protein mL62 n=1 Tax=Syphacia muris TaxID=451379 RepID=A0A0N5ASK9_9BILA
MLLCSRIGFSSVHFPLELILPKILIYSVASYSIELKKSQGKCNVGKLDTIPSGSIEKKFVRSSGPGGQNVNKTSTKCEVRFQLSGASWISDELREAFKVNYSRYIAEDGTVVIRSDKTRNQHENFKDCLQKLSVMLKTCERKLAYASNRFSDEDLEILNKRAEKAASYRLLQKRLKSQKKKNRSSDF